jgi:hypothetical protein
MTRGTTFAALALVAGLVPSLAVAGDQRLANAEADACAKGLPAESKLIYDATVQNMGGGGKIRDIVAAQTRSLVMSGKVARSTARSSAETAGKCLEILAKG